MTLPVLDNIQDFPIWATDAGRTLEPSESIKARGWAVGKRPPARWQNWYQNVVYQWLLKLGTLPICSWRIIDLAEVNLQDLRGIVYNPTFKFWLLYSRTHRAISLDGISWSSPVALADNPNRASGITGNSSMIGLDGGLIEYTMNGWTFTTANTGYAQTVQTIVTDYGGYRTVVGYADGRVKYSTSGPGGSWIDAATYPSSVGASNMLASCFTNGSTYFMGQWGNGKTWKSIDGGANWSETSTHPASLGILYITALAFDYIRGRLVVLGASLTQSYIAYSDNLGSTWTLATLRGLPALTMPGDPGYSLRYCGGTMWIAFTERVYHADSGSDFGGIWISTDNAENWDLVPLIDAPETVTSAFGIGCDGKKFVAPLNSGGYSKILVSQALI